jgi:ABC-type branched-subunit amino acid transport system permease subunit
MVSNFAEQWGVPFPFAPLLAVLCATVLGLLIGLSALRVRGVNLAIATLGVGAAVDSLLFRNPQFAGGYNGAIVPEPRLFGLDLGINAGHGEASLTFGFICLVIAALACLAVSNLRRTGTGRRMLAVRANERAAAAAGISVAQTKLLAFGISSFLAGLAGALLAYDQVGGLIPPDQFGPIASVVLLTTVFIGGVSTVAGAVIAGVAAAGGLLYYLISQNIQQFSQWQALVGGIGLILVAVRQPSGLAGYSIEHFRRSRLRHQRATAVAEPVVPARDTDATLGVD